MADIIDELKRTADLVKATADAIQAVESAQGVFDRSATLEVRNTTGRKLLPTGNNHDHGGFSVPPDGPIEPKSSQVYGTRSSGVFTGTAGDAHWKIEGTEILLNITWSVPFIGTNGTNSGLEGPASEQLVVAHTGANGNKNVPMKYMIGERTDFGPTDNDWRFCEKCKCLFDARGIEKSDCAVGGRHEHNPASFNFRLPHSTPGISHQGAWRSCLRCTGIFFDGFPGKGVCPAHVVPFHESDGSFILSHGLQPEDATHQDKWRFCMDCYGLFFEPTNASGCPANGGGAHRPFPNPGSPMPPNHPLAILANRARFNYRLSHDVVPEPEQHTTGYRRCGKCSVLFFAPEAAESTCPQGGTHEASAQSPVFQISSFPPDSGASVGNWAKCKRCKGMYFDGMTINPGGRCPVPFPPGFRLGHKPTVREFHLPHDRPGPGQNQWRFCSKCFGLFFEPASAGAPCAAGGQHVPDGFDFRLDHL
jgi:hypothetical protein